MKTKISDYRNRITIQEKITTKDSEGIVTETWEDFATVWAAVEPLRGREYFEAAAVQAENTVRIRIRYRQGITPDMRVQFQDRFFTIQSVLDINTRHQEIHLMCKESIPG